MTNGTTLRVTPSNRCNRAPRFGALVWFFVLLVALCGVGLPDKLHAASNLVEQQHKALDQATEAAEFGIRTGSVVVAPIPFNTPTIGAGLALGAGYLFKADEESNTSILGLGGFRSDNGSEGYGLTINLAWHSNRWILNSFFGRANLNYDLYARDIPFPIKQEGSLARVSLAYGVTPHLSFGAQSRYLDTTVTTGLARPPGLQARDLGLKILTFGLIADWDLRDDTLYPTSGLLLSAEAFRGVVLDGGDRDYSKAFVNFNHYRKLGAAGVVASRVSTCAVTDDTPFFDKCSIGGTDNMRGFPSTEFLDYRTASLQVEYRQILTDRIGGVIFAGAGVAGADYASLDAGGVHSAAGLGLRLRLSKKFPVDFSIDGSLNNRSEKLLYIYVGQRF